MALVKWSTMPRKSGTKVIGWMDFIMAKDNIGKNILIFLKDVNKIKFFNKKWHSMPWYDLCVNLWSAAI